MANVNPIQVQKFLKGMDYPASRAEIVSYARKHGADKNVLQTLQQLPSDNFQTPAEVSQEIGRFD